MSRRAKKQKEEIPEESSEDEQQDYEEDEEESMNVVRNYSTTSNVRKMKIKKTSQKKICMRY